MPISFDALRHGNLRRLPQFKNAKGEPAHSEADGSDWSYADWFTAAAGEMGELGNVLKKVRRGDLTLDEARGELADEIADVVTYLDILASRLDIDMGLAVRNKFNRVSTRVGATTRI